MSIYVRNASTGFISGGAESCRRCAQRTSANDCYILDSETGEVSNIAFGIYAHGKVDPARLAPYYPNELYVSPGFIGFEKGPRLKRDPILLPRDKNLTYIVDHASYYYVNGVRVEELTLGVYDRIDKNKRFTMYKVNRDIENLVMEILVAKFRG